MSQPISIRAHFDGRAIVPDEPVELKANESVIVDIHRVERKVTQSGLPLQFAEERLKAFRELVAMSAGDPIIPLGALRREKLYDDRVE